MLSLATFIQQVKRKTGYGDPADTTDQTTADIVHYTNQRRLRLWRRYPWHWVLVAFTLDLVADVLDYVLPAAVGDVVAIDNGADDSLVKKTLKEYLKWRGDATITGNPTAYMRMGTDSNKCIKIKVWPKPADSVSREAWGKQRLTRYTVADIATNTDIEYFPEEVLPVLEAGVLSDIKAAQGKAAEAAGLENFFNNEMEKMVNESVQEEDREEVSAAPDYMVFHRKRRGGTRVT